MHNRFAIILKQPLTYSLLFSIALSGFTIASLPYYPDKIVEIVISGASKYGSGGVDVSFVKLSTLPWLVGLSMFGASLLILIAALVKPKQTQRVAMTRTILWVLFGIVTPLIQAYYGIQVFLSLLFELLGLDPLDTSWIFLCIFVVSIAVAYLVVHYKYKNGPPVRLKRKK